MTIDTWVAVATIAVAVVSLASVVLAQSTSLRKELGGSMAELRKEFGGSMAELRSDLERYRGDLDRYRAETRADTLQVREALTALSGQVIGLAAGLRPVLEDVRQHRATPGT